MLSSNKRQKFTKFKPAVVLLRKKGKTYSEIKEIYKIPKGTLSYWLKDVKIPIKIRREMEKRSYQKWKKGNGIFIKKRIEDAKNLRENYKEKASKEIKNLSRKDLKMIGAMLFWAEGNSKNRNSVRFANSNPEMIKIIMRFFREVCQVPDKKIRGRVHIYPGNDYRKTLNFWRGVTKLPNKNFYKPQVQISKASKRKRNFYTLPYGTIHLNICSTEMIWKIRGWIEGIVSLMRV